MWSMEEKMDDSNEDTVGVQAFIAGVVLSSREITHNSNRIMCWKGRGQDYKGGGLR